MLARRAVTSPARLFLQGDSIMVSRYRLPAATFLVVVALLGSAWSQGANSGLPQAPQPATPPTQRAAFIDYSKPKSAFPNVLAPYSPKEVPPPDLVNTSRVAELLKDGRIMLSINDAVSLALENNLDLVLARYNLN